MAELLQKVSSHEKSICGKCSHRFVCFGIDNQPCFECNRFTAEVVRCKDCIHYDFGVCLKIYSDGAVSQYAWQARKEDDFCSYGERRTDGN